MNAYRIEYTGTFGGEANYCWVRCATVHMPELTHYGYTGSADGSHAKADKTYKRELMRKAKAAVGLTGVRGRTEAFGGDTVAFYPYGSATVLFITYDEG
jgi:hypothetical protein